MSAREMDQLKALATLEYAVARREMTRPQALAAAQQQHIPEKWCDTLRQEPGTGATTLVAGRMVRASAAGDATPQATATNAKLRVLPFSTELRRPALTRRRAEALCSDFSRKLGFPIVLAWENDSTRLEVDPFQGREIVVPGGLIRASTMTAEMLALAVAHEMGHVRLRTRDEGRADYWAALHGLRILWPEATPDQLFRRGFLAAYALLAYIGGKESEPLTLLTGDNPRITMQMGGYPSLQSRWELFKAGILDRPMPKRDPQSY